MSLTTYLTQVTMPLAEECGLTVKEELTVNPDWHKSITRSSVADYQQDSDLSIPRQGFLCHSYLPLKAAYSATALCRLHRV